jgi:Tol biopolymer transport system component
LLVQWGVWFPDGKRLLVVATAEGTTSYYMFDVAGGKSRRIAAASSLSAARILGRDLISPDGRWLARRGEGGRISMLSLDDGTEKLGSELAPGENLVRWSGDGRSLFLVERKGFVNVFTRLDPASGRREPWREISVTPDPVGLRGGAGPIAMSADGKAIFWGYQRWSDELYLVDGLK